MVGFKIVIEHKESVEGEGITWDFEHSGFPPSLTEILGVLERVKFLLQLQDEGLGDYEPDEEDEEEEDGEDDVGQATSS